MDVIICVISGHMKMPLCPSSPSCWIQAYHVSVVRPSNSCERGLFQMPTSVMLPNIWLKWYVNVTWVSGQSPTMPYKLLNKESTIRRTSNGVTVLNIAEKNIKMEMLLMFYSSFTLWLKLLREYLPAKGSLVRVKHFFILFQQIIK